MEYDGLPARDPTTNTRRGTKAGMYSATFRNTGIMKNHGEPREQAAWIQTT